MPEKNREEVLNVHLARLLKQRGIDARPERRSRGNAPDIRIELLGGERALIECKWMDGRTDLDRQLAERVDQFPDAAARLGVLYPDALRTAGDPEQALLQTSDLCWYLHSSRSEIAAAPNLHTGAVAEFADELRNPLLHIDGFDRVAAAAIEIGDALELAARQIDRHQRTAERIAQLIAQSDKEKDCQAAIRIACLILFNALAFQDRLAHVNGDAPSVDEALRGGADGLRAAWRTICDQIDYVPVFQLAADILDTLCDAPGKLQHDAIDPLRRAMTNTRHLEGQDLSGRLFHTLLTDAKFTGAYYTSVPAATMLARLVFHDWPPGIDWHDHEFPASLNIADLACGTGTLLIAVAAEVERRHQAAGGRESAQLHKAMVEQALHGYDVQLSAIHFAATSLAMLNPNIQFDHLNLYVMPIGVEGDRISLGSLDFLGVDAAPVQGRLTHDEDASASLDPERISGSGRRGAAEGELATIPELDLAIMNPPYTRMDKMLFGVLPDADRSSMTDELKRRLKPRLGKATAGLGSAFVAAAAPKLRPGEGRLALVLPATVCTGKSWAQTRALIERDFTLDTVIVSHDPERWNFSDSTDLSEVLLIATRRATPPPPPPPPRLRRPNRSVRTRRRAHHLRQPLAQRQRHHVRRPRRPSHCRHTPSRHQSPRRIIAAGR